MESIQESFPIKISSNDEGYDRKAAWDIYMTGGVLPEATVRQQVCRAWERSRILGCDPYIMKAESLSAVETEILLKEEQNFINAARPYLMALSRAAGAERHAAMLGDRNAVLLETIGDEETVRDPNFPAPGSLLSEAIAGANGIGTALAENGYAELVGPEHYIEGFHVYTCQGLPVRGPTGQVVGVLSISVRRIEAAERIHEILICAAHGIEAELRRIQLETSVTDLLKGTAGSFASSLSCLREDIIQFQAASLLHFQTAAEMVGENERDEALSLVELAIQMSVDFKRQADLCQGLTEDVVRSAEPVDLESKLQEIADLLKTEAMIREVELVISTISPLPIVIVDWGELSRSFFRGLLKAFDVAGPKGRVEVGIRQWNQIVEIRVNALKVGKDVRVDSGKKPEDDTQVLFVQEIG